jgi:hypothetical protein
METKFEGREYLVSTARYLKLDLPVPYEQMYNEALSLRSKFIDYRSKDATGWHSLPIIGKSATEADSWQSYYTSAKDAATHMTWTSIADQCPVTVNWLEKTYPSNSFGRVRFMLLEAGGVIDFHKDTDHSVLGAINIALNNPEGCKWHWRDGTSFQFEPGGAYAMNISYEHSIRNDSDQDRYHMIVHHYDSTDNWKKLMIQAMEKYEVKGDFHFSTELF